MDELEAKGLIDTDTRVSLVENKVTLVVPNGNARDIGSFDQAIDELKDGDVLMAVGSSDVPIGQCAQKIFEFYGVNESDVSDNLIHGSDAKEITARVSDASVGCGIVYGTDAYSAGLTVVDSATAEMCGSQVIYPAAVLKNAANADATKAFLDYLQTEEASAVFASAGFSPIAR